MKRRLFFALRFYPQLRKEGMTMKLTHHVDRRWHRVAQSVAFAAAGMALLVLGGGPAHAQNPQHKAIQNQITTHDGNQTSQHNSLSGQVTTHDAAQTTHDSAQTTQHNALQTAIGNLSTTADHSGLPQAWDKTLPADNPGGPCPSNSSRFTCVMGGVAVRDNETGLVWERSPSTFIPWSSAQFRCNRLTVGNRMGWRLPTLQELASLVDGEPSTTISPRLPAGHPFSNVLSSGYWSATTVAANASLAWVVLFENVFDTSAVVAGNKQSTFFVWCVRGGQGLDLQ